MQHTTSHELSQWAETDRILRADFNSDNAKIEAALLNTVRHMEFIKTVSTEKRSAASTRPPLEGINWEDWEAVIISNTQTGVSGQHYTFMLDSSLSASNCSDGGYYLAKVSSGPFVLIFLPCHDSSRQVRVIYLGETAGMGVNKATFQEVTTLSLSSDSGNGVYFSSSRTFSVYGIR